MKQQKSRRHHTHLFGFLALGVFGLATVAAILGLGNSVTEIRSAEVSRSADAVLASSGVKEEYTVALPVTYYDQLSDQCVDLYDPSQRQALRARQFEWSTCGYYGKKLEQGLVETQLDENGHPVAVAGKLTPNRGLEYSSWYNTVDGVSTEVTGTLQLRYTADGAKFTFISDEFYPLDDVSFSDGDPANTDDHNHLFTMNFAVPFTVLSSGEEMFTITADDDTFVFLNGQLALDLGGLHRAVDGAIAIGPDGEVYTSVDHADWQLTDQKLSVGDTATLQIFHADRDSAESEFAVEFTGMDLELVSGTQIAAAGTTDDPTSAEAAFAAPLGENKVFQPDSARSLIIISTVEAVIIVTSAIMLALVSRYMIQQKVQK